MPKNTQEFLDEAFEQYESEREGQKDWESEALASAAEAREQDEFLAAEHERLAADTERARMPEDLQQDHDERVADREERLAALTTSIPAARPGRWMAAHQLAERRERRERRERLTDMFTRHRELTVPAPSSPPTDVFESRRVARIEANRDGKTESFSNTGNQGEKRVSVLRFIFRRLGWPSDGIVTSQDDNGYGWQLQLSMNPETIIALAQGFKYRSVEARFGSQTIESLPGLESLREITTGLERDIIALSELYQARMTDPGDGTRRPIGQPNVRITNFHYHIWDGRASTLSGRPVENLHHQHPAFTKGREGGARLTFRVGKNRNEGMGAAAAAAAAAGAQQQHTYFQLRYGDSGGTEWKTGLQQNKVSAQLKSLDVHPEYPPMEKETGVPVRPRDLRFDQVEKQQLKDIGRLAKDVEKVEYKPEARHIFPGGEEAPPMHTTPFTIPLVGDSRNANEMEEKLVTAVRRDLAQAESGVLSANVYKARLNPQPNYKPGEVRGPVMPGTPWRRDIEGITAEVRLIVRIFQRLVQIMLALNLNPITGGRRKKRSTRRRRKKTRSKSKKRKGSTRKGKKRRHTRKK